jgi:hypothetical protein
LDSRIGIDRGSFQVKSASALRTDERNGRQCGRINRESVSERELQEDLRNAASLEAPIRTLALQLARKQAENFGRIPVYCSRIGNKIWPKGWRQLARRGFSFAEQGFRQSVYLTPNRGALTEISPGFLSLAPTAPSWARRKRWPRPMPGAARHHLRDVPLQLLGQHHLPFGAGFVK